jgi:hypothetical protein
MDRYQAVVSTVMNILSAVECGEFLYYRGIFYFSVPCRGERNIMCHKMVEMVGLLGIT